MVDKNLVLRKLSDLDGYREQILEFAGISVSDYSQDWKIQRIIERTLQIMIEICADVANHIISDKKLAAPQSYADAFKILRDEGILETELADTMQEMAKFRNIIVHGYDKIDEAIVVDLLKRRLGDFAGYRDAILAQLT